MAPLFPAFCEEINVYWGGDSVLQDEDGTLINEGGSDLGVWTYKNWQILKGSVSQVHQLLLEFLFNTSQNSVRVFSYQNTEIWMFSRWGDFPWIGFYIQ